MMQAAMHSSNRIKNECSSWDVYITRANACMVVTTGLEPDRTQHRRKWCREQPQCSTLSSRSKLQAFCSALACVETKAAVVDGDCDTLVWMDLCITALHMFVRTYISNSFWILVFQNTDYVMLKRGQWGWLSAIPKSKVRALMQSLSPATNPSQAHGLGGGWRGSVFTLHRFDKTTRIQWWTHTHASDARQDFVPASFQKLSTCTQRMQLQPRRHITSSARAMTRNQQKWR